MDEKPPAHDEMILQMGHTLAQFQLIEQWMKAYLEIAMRIIRRLLPPEITFRFASADYEDAALGTLLTMFKRLNSNEQLHADLARMKRDRDFVAHKAAAEIGSTFDDPEINRSLYARFVALEKEANRLFHVIGDEVDRLKNYEHDLATEPNQAPQRNAGSRLSSGDSTASESSSSLGPRG